MGRAYLKPLTGKEPIEMVVLLKKMQVGYLLHDDNHWQVGVAAVPRRRQGLQLSLMTCT